MHLSNTLNRASMGDIDIIHAHDAKAVEFMYDSVFRMQVPIVMTLHVSATAPWEALTSDGVIIFWPPHWYIVLR